MHQRVIHQYPVVQLSEDMNDFNQQEASPSQAMSGIFASEDEVLKQPVKGNSDFKGREHQFSPLSGLQPQFQLMHQSSPVSSISNGLTGTL